MSSYDEESLAELFMEVNLILAYINFLKGVFDF